MNKPTLLISSCLCATVCRYDGKHNRIDELEALQQIYSLVPVCPEELGGLSTPRNPAERREGRVITCTGEDVTEAFTKGAQLTLRIAIQQGCQLAVLKAKSPSCGKGFIYDGSFSKKLISGNGVTVERLKAHHILVYTEDEVSLLLDRCSDDRGV